MMLDPLNWRLLNGDTEDDIGVGMLDVGVAVPPLVGTTEVPIFLVEEVICGVVVVDILADVAGKPAFTRAVVFGFLLIP